MIQIKLIPDGGTEIPVEARDDEIMASHLQSASPSSGSPVDTWRDVKRVVPGSNEYILLRVGDEQATLSDYSSSTLDAFANAVVNNIAGLKKHPDGWKQVDLNEGA